MNDKLAIKDSSISGKGSFARKKFKCGEYITTLDGIEFTPKEIEKAIAAGIISPDDPLQIKNDLFLILNNSSKKINHSCNPNTGIRNRSDLYAITDINVDDEITFDYSTTVGTNTKWEMDCCCNANTCRKKIRNILSISQETRNHYYKLNLLPDFIKTQLDNCEIQSDSDISDHIFQLYLNSANALKLPVESFRGFSFLRICIANTKYSFQIGITPFNDAACTHLGYYKFFINQILHAKGLPILKGELISGNNLINGSWKLPKLSYPIVAKPSVNVSNGLDVLCNIRDEETLIKYLNENSKKYSYINIEKFEADLVTYRVLVFYDKVIGVTRLDPASIIGDGLHSIHELIKIENKKRVKLIPALPDIKIDEECYARLKEMNLTLDDTPKINEKIILSYTCHTERGGTDISLGKSICPQNAKLLCHAAKVLGLNLVGFDILCEDIQRPIEKSRGFIIEANSNPDITYHESPSKGVRIPVTKIFLKRLIRKHPIAYAKLYCESLLKPYSFLIRAALVFGLLEMMIKLFK